MGKLALQQLLCPASNRLLLQKNSISRKKTKILHSNFYYYYYFKMYYHPSHLNFQRKKAPRQCGGVTATTGELAPAKLSPIWRNYCIKPSQLLLLLLIHRISWEVCTA